MTNPDGRPVPAPVGRTARTADAAALALLVAGAGMYAYARHEMQEISAGRMRFARIDGIGGGWNVTHWGEMVRLSNIGLGVAAAGVLVGVVAFVLHARRRNPHPIDEQADHP